MQSVQWTVRLALGCLLVATVASARILTVAPSGATYTTIAAGISAAQPGDTVLVQAGTYNASVTSVRDGQANARILVKASPRRQAVVTGATITHDYITLEGFEMNAGGITVNGVIGVDVVDNYVHEAQGTAFTITGGTYSSYTSRDVRFINNRAYRCGYGFVIKGTNLLIEGNEVDRIYKYSTSGDADYSRVFGDSITFRGNYFHGTLQSEIGDAHLDLIQFFSVNGEYLRNLLVENNTFMDAHQGIMSSNTGRTNTGWWIIRNNVYAHLWAWGVHFWGIGNVQVYNNVSGVST